MNPLANILADAGLLTPDQFWGMTRGEVELCAAHHPQYAERLAATGLLDETFARYPLNGYPLNGYRLTLGYADLDTRPPIPVTGRLPNPLSQ